MELELKHLAPYLPYGLKVGKHFKNEFYSEVMDTSIMSSLFNDSRKKPILRPLSDLMIDNIFEDKAICFIDKSDNGGDFTIDDIYFKYKESSFSDWRNAYEMLLKHHFDIHNLIDKGLAIDINTLK